MASSATRGNGRRPGGLFRLVMLAAGLSAVLPAGTQAQDVDRSAYLAAESAYSAALRARDLARDLLDDAMDQATEGRESGDQARYGRALAIYQERAEELELSNRLLADAAGRLDQARRAYLESVFAQLDGLFEELPQATDERERDLLARRIDNLYDEADQLARPVEINDDPFPEINIDPGDTRDDIRAKADLLDRQAARHQGLLVDIEAQIELYERRLRHARMWQDFGADLSRFDDLVVPVGTSGTTTDNAVRPIGNEELSQHLEELSRTRESVMERRDIAMARAEEFRQRIGGERV